MEDKKYKVYPWTKHGKDRIRIIFDTEEDRDAFMSVLVSLEEYIEQEVRAGNVIKDGPDRKIKGFKFQTTLQTQVVSEQGYSRDLNKLLSLQGMRIFSKDDVLIFLGPEWES